MGAHSQERMVERMVERMMKRMDMKASLQRVSYLVTRCITVTRKTVTGQTFS